jgi:thioredoxin reductase
MTYDVIVIGGGPAGLSGAVALGRALRSVLVIDSDEPRNGPAAGIHNFLTRDGMTPAEFRAAGRAEVHSYGGEVITARVVSATSAPGGFTVVVQDGREFTARRLLVTTGTVDQLPDIPGLRERWGRTVLHCPYCHGYEERDKAIGIIGVGPMSVEQAVLWRHWTPELTLYANDQVIPDDPRLAALGITVVPGRIDRITDGEVLLADGTAHKAEALVVFARVFARAEPLDSLGLATVEDDFGIFVPVQDPTGRTTVPGVWVAGNVADYRAQVITSAAAGLMAGAGINADLIAGDAP